MLQIYPSALIRWQHGHKDVTISLKNNKVMFCFGEKGFKSVPF
jgi:hypothetical protein